MKIKAGWARHAPTFSAATQVCSREQARLPTRQVRLFGRDRSPSRPGPGARRRGHRRCRPNRAGGGLGARTTGLQNPAVGWILCAGLRGGNHDTACKLDRDADAYCRRRGIFHRHRRRRPGGGPDLGGAKRLRGRRPARRRRRLFEDEGHLRRYGAGALCQPVREGRQCRRRQVRRLRHHPDGRSVAAVLRRERLSGGADVVFQRHRHRRPGQRFPGQVAGGLPQPVRHRALRLSALCRQRADVLLRSATVRGERRQRRPENLGRRAEGPAAPSPRPAASATTGT